MNWEKLDWEALDRLRAGFLGGTAADGVYWKSLSDLAAYDLTYGERIGWKWDAVLAELRLRGWKPSCRDRALRAVDWGCGSGIAGRRVVDFFGPDRFGSLQLMDHSPLAQTYAIERARAAFPAIQVDAWPQTSETVDLLIVSHVLNELSFDAQTALKAAMARAAAVLWVEPGTSDVARTLQRWRNDLTGEFRVIAPCPHQAPCGLLTPENARHWCHHFAPIPAGVFADRDWVKFGQRAGIDLRSLPYAFLALDRTAKSAVLPENLARVIGRPEHFKPYARVLSCEREGVYELRIMKRPTAALYKQLERTKAPLLYAWRHDGERVLEGGPYERSDAEQQGAIPEHPEPTKVV